MAQTKQPPMLAATASGQPLTLLRLREVCRRTGKSRTDVYRRIAAGDFPQPVKLGERASAWPEHEVFGDRFTFQTFDDSPAKSPALSRVMHGTLRDHAATLASLNERGPASCACPVSIIARESRSRRACCHWTPSARPTDCPS